jgi:hypothetical protein
MTRNGFYLRLAASIAIDLIDFTLGRIPIVGSVEEGLGTLVLFALWGPVGLANLWELADITEQIDAFIPTATLIALYVGWREGYLLGAKEKTHDPRPDRAARRGGDAQPAERPRRLPNRRT